MGEPLAMQRGINVYWYHGDGLGSVTEVTDVAEAVAEQYVYDSFGNLYVYDGLGNPLPQTGIGNYFTYIGREYDYESDLYYLRARYYSPEQGRFLSRDPLDDSETLVLPFRLSLYTYARNNPVRFKDPLGLYYIDQCFGFGYEGTDIRSGMTYLRPLVGKIKDQKARKCYQEFLNSGTIRCGGLPCALYGNIVAMGVPGDKVYICCSAWDHNDGARQWADLLAEAIGHVCGYLGHKRIREEFCCDMGLPCCFVPAK